MKGKRILALLTAVTMVATTPQYAFAAPETNDVTAKVQSVDNQVVTAEEGTVLSEDGYTLTIDGVDYPVGGVTVPEVYEIPEGEVTDEGAIDAFNPGMILDTGEQEPTLYSTYLEKGKSSYGYNKLNPTTQQPIYNALYAAAKAFAESGLDQETYRLNNGLENYQVSTSSGDETLYRIGAVDFKDNAIEEDAAKEVVDTFLSDNPQFYWIYGGYTWSFDSNSKITGIHIYCNSKYTTAESRNNVDESIKNKMSMIYGPAVEKAGSDVHDKVRAIHDTIIEEINYKYKGDGSTPDDSTEAHSIIGVFTKYGAVCEGYAKTFSFLTNYYGIPSVYITGYTSKAESSTGSGKYSYSGGHAWNLVSFDNGGKYYYVDTTWDDYNGNAGSWLGDGHYMWYAIDKDSFDARHFPWGNNGINDAEEAQQSSWPWLYEIPTNIGTDMSNSFYDYYGSFISESLDDASVQTLVNTALEKSPFDWINWLRVYDENNMTDDMQKIESILKGTSSGTFLKIHSDKYIIFQIERPISKIVNNSYSTTQIVGSISNPVVSDFTFKDRAGTIVETGVSIETQWYSGDYSAGQTLPDSSLGTVPTSAGTYTAVITASVEKKSGYPIKAKSLRLKVDVQTKPLPGFTKDPEISGTYGQTLTAMFKEGNTDTTGTWSVENGDTYLPAGTTVPVTVTFTPQDTNAYGIKTFSVTPSVSKKQIEVTIDSKSKKYDEEIPTLTSNASLDMLVAGDNDLSLLGITLSTTAEKTSNVGTYDITGTSTSTNYDVTLKKGTLTINPAKPEKPAAPVISEANILDTQITLNEIAGCVYSKDNGATWQESNVFTGLTPDTEYTFCQKKVAAGNYSDSDPSDAVTKRTKKKLPVFTTDPVISGTYGQQLKDMFVPGTTDVTGTWTVENEENYPEAGDTTPVIVTFTPYDTTYDAKTFSLTPSVAKKAVVLEWSTTTEFDYDGNAHGVTAVITNAIADDNVEVDTYESNSNINAGTYTAKVLTLKGTKAENYCLAEESDNSCAYKIKALDISEKTLEITTESDLVYTGNEQTLNVTSVKLDGKDITYNVTGNKATAAGSYSYTITATGNYSGTVTKAFTVAKAEAKLTLSNLAQTEGSTSPVKVTIDPASEDAQPVIEYKVRNTAAGETEYTWTTTMPTGNGSYEVRAYLLNTKAGNNLVGYNDFAEADTARKVATGTLVISKKTSGGSSGGSSSGGTSGGSSSGGTSGGSGGSSGGSSSGGSSGGSSSGGTSGGSGGSSGGSSNGGSSDTSSGDKNNTDDNTGNKDENKPVDTNPDTTVDVVTNTDGSKTETTVVKNEDGSSVKTEVTTNTDGSEKTVVTESSSEGTVKTTTTAKDETGKITSVTEKNEIKDAAKNTDVSVTVKKDGEGNVTSAKATIVKETSGKKATLSGAVANQIADIAGTNTQISMKVVDTKGKTQYVVKADSTELKPGNELYMFKYDTKTKKYIMVDAKIYKVSKAGSVSVNISTKATYELVNVAEAKEIENQIKKTIQLKKNTATISIGGKVKADLSKLVDMSNVKKITYSSENGNTVKVSKTGTIQAKKSGNATVKVKVTLKNGSTKTVKMKIKIKN